MVNEDIISLGKLKETMLAPDDSGMSLSFFISFHFIFHGPIYTDDSFRAYDALSSTKSRITWLQDHGIVSDDPLFFVCVRLISIRTINVVFGFPLKRTLSQHVHDYGVAKLRAICDATNRNYLCEGRL
ncbi:hypothetical protein J8273_8672 [Carpediemonas membranifera]|uniref:Uncharacterized protein n=1 Tax=Carpediemonas membranifera TaxID=201153 RepID=A0A8J6APU2_9EUKA|nr:hypothetical protein J8273_8672 [Carpediemonas membranifera]|eukprot:KAG9389983.1 hypothetical protein J8273_8672 [Carpediemonas membranifera]